MILGVRTRVISHQAIFPKKNISHFFCFIAIRPMGYMEKVPNIKKLLERRVKEGISFVERRAVRAIVVDIMTGH